MWELDYKESWALKNGCFWTVVMEKTLESPLDCREIQPVHPKGQSWVFIGRTDAEAKTPILWPSDADSFEKTLMLGKIEGGRGDDRGWDGWMASPTQWTLGVGDGQGGLACCSLWGHKELDMTERLNWTRDRASVVVQMVKNPPAMQEIWVWSLGQEDPLKKGMTACSSVLAWRIPLTEEPGGLQSTGSQKVGHDWVGHHYYL